MRIESIVLSRDNRLPWAQEAPGSNPGAPTTNLRVRPGHMGNTYAWITPRLDLPRGSLSEKIRSGATAAALEKVDADIWFADWERGGILLEEAKHFSPWDQTLTLLSFENGEVPPQKKEEAREDEEELGLEELDGNLRWPSKKRRR